MTTVLETPSQLLDTVKASDFIGMRPQTLENWRLNKKGPEYLRIGQKAIRYRQSDLVKFMEAKVSL